MALVLYDLLLRLKYPILDKDIVVYGKPGGGDCDVYLGSNEYDSTRVLQDDEKIVMNFVMASVSHQHFAIHRCGQAMLVKDLSRNGTCVSREGGEYRRAQRVQNGDFDATEGLLIEKGSRIRLGESSDHVLELMTDEQASELIVLFESLRDVTEETPEPKPAAKPPKKKKRLFGLFGR